MGGVGSAGASVRTGRVLPAPGARARSGAGGLSGLTWGLVPRVGAPVSGRDGVSGCAGVGRLSRALGEVAACGPESGWGAVGEGRQAGVLRLGGNRATIWYSPMWGSEFFGDADTGVPNWGCRSTRGARASAEAARRWGRGSLGS